MIRRQKIRQVHELSARIDGDSSKLAGSLERLSASLAHTPPILMVSGGLLVGFCAGRVLGAAQSGVPARSLYRMVLLARGWVGRLSLARLVFGARALGAHESPDVKS